MSKGWAAIVYGRTYHLDFRFITVPHDFTEQEINWASRYIVATTSKARNLAGSPRWSLFKNHHHCIVGVTCMVKDLIGDTVKDNQGRPLYVFVGYVADLTSSPELENLPAYDSDCLDDFKSLYQEIEQVWLIKNYEQDSRHPFLSQYSPLNFSDSAIPSVEQDLPQLNHYLQHPEQIYLWQNSSPINNLLWQSAAQSTLATSICLNIKGKALTNSSFLNQSCSQADWFQILEQTGTQKKLGTTDFNRDANTQFNLSLSQKISARAKEDIDLTLQQATKVAIASQELLNQLSDWNQSDEITPKDLDTVINEPEFGFKMKKSSSHEQDWF